MIYNPWFDQRGIDAVVVPIGVKAERLPGDARRARHAHQPARRAGDDAAQGDDHGARRRGHADREDRRRLQRAAAARRRHLARRPVRRRRLRSRRRAQGPAHRRSPGVRRRLRRCRLGDRRLARRRGRRRDRSVRRPRRKRRSAEQAPARALPRARGPHRLRRPGRPRHRRQRHAARHAGGRCPALRHRPRRRRRAGRRGRHEVRAHAAAARGAGARPARCRSARTCCSKWSPPTSSSSASAPPPRTSCARWRNCAIQDLPMRRSIATVSLSGTLPEKLEAIAAARFDGIELFENDFIHFNGSAAEVRAMAADLGLDDRPLPAVPRLRGHARGAFARSLDRAERKFDLMQALGARDAGLLERLAAGRATTTSCGGAAARAGRARRRGATCGSATRRWPGAAHVEPTAQAWDDRAARRPSAPRPHPRQLPHAVARRRPAGIARHAGRHASSSCRWPMRRG